MEQQVEDLQVLLRQAETDKRQIGEQLAHADAQRSRAEDEVRELSRQTAQLSQQLSEQRATATQIRLLAEESERALDEQQRQLAFRARERADMEQANCELEQRLCDAEGMADALRDECGQLRARVAALDKEKDRLVAAVDEKCVANVQLQRELSSKARSVA